MLKTNEYFNGNVKSIAFDAPEGKATIGVMRSGTYEFTSKKYEYLNVIAGNLEVKFEDDDKWNKIEELETFEARPHETFSVRTNADLAYFRFFSDTALGDNLNCDED